MWATALISVSVALRLSTVYTETMDMGLLHCMVSLFTPQISMVLIVPTNIRMARLSA